MSKQVYYVENLFKVPLINFFIVGPQFLLKTVLLDVYNNTVYFYDPFIVELFLLLKANNRTQFCNLLCLLKSQKPHVLAQLLIAQETQGALQAPAPYSTQSEMTSSQGFPENKSFYNSCMWSHFLSLIHTVYDVDSVIESSLKSNYISFNIGVIHVQRGATQIKKNQTFISNIKSTYLKKTTIMRNIRCVRLNYLYTL